ncbi:hypothetical protein FB567DRAFT_500731 [Paraphoma chrysanthemicola]|uniref:Heterokaryon incompatibility domain-containing protein n=1 Tax=Paraphoma chrysanthemicola TaxID=798071 RepID=A0A8K0R2A2_9PLEO|nr:hypothetical protein FB567DRAFT_500731 [Paraphoma chrysanthemicola]
MFCCPYPRDSSLEPVQSWLFFGLASEALGQDIKHEDFATVSKGESAEKYIDARIPEWYLEKLKARWKQLDRKLSADRFEALRNAVKKKFESAKLAAVALDLLCIEFDDEDSTIAKVLLSVHMLLYVVAHTLGRSKMNITQANPTISVATRFLMRRMIGNGWCKKRLNLFESAPLFYPAMYFLSSFDPPRNRIEDHSRCDSSRCQVSNSLSDPIHRTAECLCEDIPVPIEHVNRIIATGGFPLVKVTWSATAKTMLEVVPYTPGTIYIAISHVWADRQFGSSQNALPGCQLTYLDEVISTIPTAMDQWGLVDWLINWRKTTPLTREIEPPSRTYQYFWLDSFCIPQASEHADLRSQAIGLMNLIYAAARHTLVFDKALQALDGGRRPSSLVLGGRPTYYAPSDEHLLDVVSSIYASNWMGRAWTLQEGVLSGHIIFPLNGSFAYLKLLWPNFDAGVISWGVWRETFIQLIPEAIRRGLKGKLPRKHRAEMEAKVDKRVRGDAEPLRESVRSQIYEHMKQTLHVEQYQDYARTPADRAARFVKAHHALQSRTTTQAEDIPLILMNMSCLNANAISQNKTADARMKQLFYSLESLPAELLFSNCTRLGSCEVDAWIPHEIAKGKFEGDHTLKLGPLGFTFRSKKGCQPLPFYLLSSASRAQSFRLALPSQKDNKPCVKHYDVQALQIPGADKINASTSMWCVVVDRSLQNRGARFVIDRVSGDKYFLNFDCALTLTEINTEDDRSDEIQEPGTSLSQTSKDQIGAALLTGEFILHRSHDPKDLSISRPQNPEQYSDRLIFICSFICELLSYLERPLLRHFFSDENSLSTLFYCFYGLYSWKKRKWVEDWVRAFVHTAWMATYGPDWDPNGRWKWFWKVSNWEPPVPFKMMLKWYLKLLFSLCFAFGSWNRVAVVTFYWMPLYDGWELLIMYAISLVGKVVPRMIF